MQQEHRQQDDGAEAQQNDDGQCRPPGSGRGATRRFHDGRPSCVPDVVPLARPAAASYPGRPRLPRLRWATMPSRRSARRRWALAATAPWATWAVLRATGAERGFPLVPALSFTPHAAATAVLPLALALRARSGAAVLLAAGSAVLLAGTVLAPAVRPRPRPGSRRRPAAGGHRQPAPRAGRARARSGPGASPRRRRPRRPGADATCRGCPAGGRHRRPAAARARAARTAGPGAVGLRRGVDPGAHHRPGAGPRRLRAADRPPRGGRPVRPWS